MDQLIRLKDEAADLTAQLFPDASYVYGKPILSAGPSTDADYRTLQHNVMHDPRVVSAMSALNRVNGIPKMKIEREAHNILAHMNSRISTKTSKIAVYFLRKFWRSCFDGIFINPQGVEMLKQAVAASTPSTDLLKSGMLFVLY